ncbi:MAG: hypothetical protein EOO04_15745 [Chitinophagaceae bacterium]|nr:MAG: hypothetical protein EOO04_15745 [Chitinophagaceae bacterium]
MSKLFLVLFFLPILAEGQEKNVISFNRVFVKSDKVQPFEKALASHAQKYHKGDVTWRVSFIESGPSAGGYLIVEGPTTWESMDKRGNLGVEHTSDWEQNVMPFTTEKYESGYLVYRPDLSTVQLSAFSDKTAINHVFYRPGYFEESEAILKNLKKAWEGSQTIAVYEASSSGPPQFVIVVRYKDGLKERTPGIMKPLKERYEAANGAGSWIKYTSFLKTSIEHSWSELVTHRKDLSSN